MKHKGNRVAASEEGFAAIIIAVVLITVLSLLTVGFAELMRREQKSALDRQLSSVAYYAAESGINDAMKALDEGYTDTKDSCGPLPASTGPSGYLSSNVVGATEGTSISKYTCLLIDPAPFDLKFDGVGRRDDTAKVVTLTGMDPESREPVAIGSMTIAWQSQGGKGAFTEASWLTGGNARFPRAWTRDGSALTGVLRTVVTPVPAGNIKRQDLINSAFTAYLYPKQGAAGSFENVAYSSGIGANAGIIIDGRCHKDKSPAHCAVNITGLNASQYMVRLASIYGSSNVIVSAKDTNGAAVRLAGAQALVDSTGNAQGVLRRVQVRVPYKTALYPQYSVEAGQGICKQLEVEPNSSFRNC